MQLKRRKVVVVLLCVTISLSGVALWQQAQIASPHQFVAARVAAPNATAAKIVAGAKAQNGTWYDASYRTISYPNGDFSDAKNGRKIGACSDVVVRALRFAGLDLQRLMHDDMTRHFALYPQLWDLNAPNASIDHRRVPNQMTFFRRFGQTLPTSFNSSTRSSWRPGDIVCWDTGNGRTHTGVLSDGIDVNGVPLVIHNNGVCREDDCLTRWKIIGHFRFPK